MNSEQFSVGGINVSRETFEQLKSLSHLIQKWTAKINLIAPKSIPELWTRHIEDSAQVFSIAGDSWSSWTDIGSGGGLPALVVAILDEKRRPMTLVESDQRKCLFLNTARRELGLNINVINGRIEDQRIEKADILSARALAPLDKLLSFSEMLKKPEGRAIFLKGVTFQDEIDVANRNWGFSVNSHVSTTSSEARVLEISRIVRREC